jgi:autotransporter-associated beta strand protein
MRVEGGLRISLERRKTLKLQFNSKKTFDGVISGTGSLVKLGTDILELTADNLYSGSTTIEDGVLVAGVPIAGQGTSFALGKGDVFLLAGTLRTPSLDPLTINVGGNYTQGPGGRLALGIAGINEQDYDHVQVGGNASLNGTLAVSSACGRNAVSELTPGQPIRDCSFRTNCSSTSSTPRRYGIG